MKQNKIFKLPIILLLVFTCLIVIVSQCIRIYYNKKEQPYDIKDVNITTNSLDIYWKSKDNSIQSIVYKEVGSKSFTNSVSTSYAYYDTTSSQYVYHTKIENLEDTTQYVYKIKSPHSTYGEYTFETDDIGNSISLQPSIVNGNLEKYRLYIVNTGDDTILIDTQNHGTYAINSTINNPTFIEYANYGNQEEVLGATSSNNPICYSSSVVTKNFSNKEEAVDYLAELLSEANERTTNPRSKMSQEQLESYIEKAEKISSSDAQTIVSQITNRIKSDEHCAGNSTSLCAVANYNNVQRTMLLVAVKNGCDEENGCDDKQVDDAANDMKNLLSWYEKKLKEQVVSYKDTISRIFVDGQGTNTTEDTERGYGHLAARMCYQVPWCKKYSSRPCSWDDYSECSCDPSTNAGRVYINGASDSNGEVIENYKEETCTLSIPCIDQMCNDCGCSIHPENPGCQNPANVITTDGNYVSSDGEYHCPQDFDSGNQREFLLSEGETGFYNNGLYYCYSEQISNRADVQRGTPSVQFGIGDQTQKCVYPTLRDYEIDTAVSDSYITGGILNEVGHSFAAQTQIKSYQTCFDCNGCSVIDESGTPTGTVLSYGFSAGGSYSEGGNNNNDGDNSGKGSIGFSCYESEETLSITNEDVECTSDNGCACVYSETGVASCAEKGDICKANGTISTQYCSKEELVINITTEDQECTSSNGCACLYTSGKTYQCVNQGDICHKDETVTTKESDEQPRRIGMQFVEGNNFFEAFDIANTDDISIKTAKDLINYTKHSVVTVASFASNQWTNIVKYDDKVCFSADDKICGIDFDLVPGNIYYVVARAPFKLSVYANGLVSSTQEYSTITENVTGWNLLPTGLFIKEEKGTLDIINNPKYNVTQVAVWEDSTSNYEYTIKNSLGEIYGSDVDLTKQTGIFIKISSESE